MPGASSLLTPRGWAWFLGLGAALVIGVPLLNALPPAGSALQLPDYLVPLLGKYLCYALLALSLDLIWGYAGILSLGHGAFFALGGYAMGMYLMRQIGTRGVYANAELPDFMVFLNWKALPWYWWGFDHFAFAALMVLVVPGVLALVFGWFAFRSRVTGVYLSIITQALTYALWLAFLRDASRHHHSELFLHRQFDRDRHLGGGGRPRHAARRDHRRGGDQFRQVLAHRIAPGGLAVRARRAVRAGDARLPQGHSRRHRPAPRLARARRAAGARGGR